MVDQGFKVIDFHCHFPIAMNWGAMGGGRGGRGRPESAFTGGSAYEASEQSKKAVRDYSVSLRAEWRLAHCFEAPETEERTPREQADRWAAEIDKYELERVVWVTGGGNDKLSEIVSWYPDKFIGFAHHNPFADDAADELRRAVNEKGLKGLQADRPGPGPAHRRPVRLSDVGSGGRVGHSHPRPLRHTGWWRGRRAPRQHEPADASQCCT